MFADASFRPELNVRVISPGAIIGRIKAMLAAAEARAIARENRRRLAEREQDMRDVGVRREDLRGA